MCWDRSLLARTSCPNVLRKRPVSTRDPRDRSVDHLLRQASGSLSVSDQCVEGETLAAWVEGALPQASAASVEKHLADCARCQALLAAFVRSEPPIAARGIP